MWDRSQGIVPFQYTGRGNTRLSAAPCQTFLHMETQHANILEATFPQIKEQKHYFLIAP